MNKRFCKNNFEFFLGWGYTRGLGSKSNNRFVSFISALSILGIFLGVAALIIVLSVTNGFQREVRERMLSVVPHVQVYPAPDSPAGWELTLSQSIEKNKEVVGIAPYMSSQSIFLQDGEMVGVKVEGIDPMQEGKVSEVPKKIIQGRLDDLKEGEFNIVLGIELARRLGLEIKKDTFSLGEPVTLLMPETNFHTNEQSPRLFSFNVVGILNTGHFEIDKSFAYVHVNDAKKLFHEGNMGLRVKLKDMDQAKTVSRWIEDNASQPVLTQDWTSINPAWFSELQSFKVMISIILFIITIVGGFSLVSMLVMTVNDKQADIAILRTQGASRRSIMHIFMIQGALIGGLGTLLGVIFGVLVAWNIGSIVHGIELMLNIEALPKGVYFINRMPSEVRLGEVIVIAAVSFGLSLLATVYPSRKAAAVEPAKALRYE